MPETETSLDARIDALSGVATDGATAEAVDETEETQQADEDTQQGTADEDQPADGEAEESPDAAEAPADEDDDWSDDADESDTSSDDENGPAFDRQIYDALKDNPALVSRLKGHEKGFQNLHKQFTEQKEALQAESAKIGQFEERFLSEKAPLDAQTWLIEQMAESRGLGLDEYLDLLKGEATDKYATKVEADLDARLRRMEQERETDRQERIKAEQAANEEKQIRAESVKMQNRILAEIGWKVPQEKIVEAIKRFPELRAKPADAVIAAFPSRYRAHIQQVANGQAKGPTLPKSNKGTMKPALGPNSSLDDAWDVYSKNA